jgi:hypothetical protein
VAGIQKEYRDFTGGEELRVFFEKDEIGGSYDRQNRTLDDAAASVRNEIDQILQNNVSAPFGGLAGEKLVNVLEVNLELCKRYEVPK